MEEIDKIKEIAELQMKYDWTMEWAMLADKAREVNARLYELLKEAYIDENYKNSIYQKHIIEQRRKNA